jgi:hypothetical protein
MFKQTSKPGHLEVISHKGREPVQPPKLLGHIRTQTLLSGEQLLAHMFSAVDDLFYDLSKRASSNNEANLYFEAMREIRINREGTAKRFLHQVGLSFSDLLDRDRFGTDARKEQAPQVNLSIVEGDELEVDLARTTMISSARSLYQEELHELCARLDHLLLQVRVDETTNPLDPEQLTDAFIDACQEQLHINIKAKLIVFKLFEKHLLKQLGHIYNDANQVLMDAGILPKVPKSIQPERHGRGQAGHLDEPASHSGLHQSPLGFNPVATQAAFAMSQDAISVLLAAARQAASHRQTQGLAPAINCFIYTNNPGPLMASSELAHLLTNNQKAVEEKLAQEAPRNLIGDIVTDLLASNDPTQPHSLAQADEDVINLVALFFDQILEDEQLPTAVQSLICRLQIPVLKVAIKDRRFFDDAEHPARQLINGLTAAGLELDDSKPLDRDPIYKKMLEVVQQINHQYTQDDSIFQQALTGLTELIEREKHKTSLVEQRTVQAEEGQYRMLQARLMAQNLVYEKIKDQALPDDISEFLCCQWLQVLIFIQLRHGQDSAEWMSAEQTVIDLVWLSHDHPDQRSQQRRERMLPELLDRIDQGLEAVMTELDQRNRLVDELETTLKSVSSHSIAADAFHTLSDEQKEELGRGEDRQKSWSEMSAIERQMARHEEVYNQFYLAAKDMPLGTWILYRDETSGRLLRCKLSAKIDSDSYLFVNRLGFKVLEKSRKRLALDLQNQRARVLDARPFFDRVMTLLVGQLEAAQ